MKCQTCAEAGITKERPPFEIESCPRCALSPVNPDVKIVQKFSVSKEEMLNAQYGGVQEGGLILSILKEKGAPILGYFFLEPDPAFDYNVTIDSLSRDREYKFWRKENSK